MLALLACIAPAVSAAGTTPLPAASLWGIAPSGASTPGASDLKTLRSEGINALVLDVQRLGKSKTAGKRIDAMRAIANSSKMSLVALIPQRGTSPAARHALKLCGTTNVRCATIAPSVSAAIRMAGATDKTRQLVAVYVSKPSMLAQLASLKSVQRRILVIAPLYKTFNDQLWGSLITSAAASRAVDLAVAPVSPLGSPSVQRFGATLSAQSTTAGTGPDVTAPSAPSVSVVGVTASSASVWWLPSVDDVGVAAYRVYVGGTLFDAHGTSPETVGSLPCGTPVTIGVDAVDAAGNASAKSTVTAVPGPCGGGGGAPVAPAPPSDTTPPSMPTGVSVSGVSQTAVTLSWSPSTDDVGVAGYRLYKDGAAVGSVTGTNFTFTGLSCATTYALGVVAFDAAGNVSDSGLSNVATQACAGDSTPPSTPSGLATSAVGQTSATLSWSASTDDTGVTGYRLFQGGSQVGTSATTSFNYTGLTCATTYTLGVAAVDATGNVSGTATKSLTTAACPDTAPPSTPTALATSSVGQTSVALSWTGSTDNVGVTGYRTFRDGTQVGTPAGTSYSFAGLTCGTTYTLGVAAVDAAGNVSGTASVNAATAACPDTTPPSTPSGLATSAVGATSATLSWTASTDDTGVTGYRLLQNGSQVGTSTTTSFNYTGLTCATTYTLGVAAVDAAGNVSGIASVNVPTAACPDATPPSTPTGLATSAVTQTSATLSWTGSTDNVGVTGYRLFQGGTQVDTSATTSYGYTGLTCGTTYTLGVAAVDAAGNVSGTATKSLTTTACTDTTPPSTPTGLATSSIGQASVALSWTASTDNVGVTGYRVFRDGAQVGTPTSTGFSFTGLTCNTTYTLGVAAVDASGNVSGTATKSATTAACPDTTAPSTPTGLATSAVGTTSATLSWTASTDNVAVTGYRLFQNGNQVGTSATTSFSYAGLTCATTYTLGVAAVDAAVNVSSMATKSVTTAACPDTTAPTTPSGLTVGSAGQTSLSLSWNASTDNVGVTGYRLFQNSSQVGTSVSPGYIFGGLSCGTTYTLGVAAVDGAGNVSGTASVSGSTTACSSGGSNWAGTFSCFGSGSCSGLTPPACTSTISSGLQAALNSASGGNVICLNSGSYSRVTLSSQTFSSTVTVRPASSATVTLAGFTLGGTTNLHITGVGGTMNDGGDFVTGCGHNLTFDYITYTGGVVVEPSQSCSHDMTLLWDHDRFDNLGQVTWEGRFNIQALDTGPSQPDGVTISNSHFGGSGNGSDCSDGIDALGGAYGTVIGPGNEFTGMAQSNCGAHVDPIQFYGGTATVVTGNYFHDNGDGSGGIMSPDGDVGYKIANNVFNETGIYPYAIAMGGCANCSVTHNVFINANLEIGTSNDGSKSTGVTARDNVFQNAGLVTVGSGNTYSATYNLNAGVSGTGNLNGTPVFASSPTSGYYHSQLASSSPGYNAGSDGKSMGIAPGVVP